MTLSKHQASSQTSIDELPSFIAGPVVRHCDVAQLNFWLVTTQAFNFTFKLYESSKNNELDESECSLLFAEDLSAPISKSKVEQIKIGESAYINLISISADEHLPENIFPENTILYYDIIATASEQTDKAQGESITSLPQLLYSEQNLPSLTIKPSIEKLLHGSCRKPHYKSEDGLKQVDSVLKTTIDKSSERPSMLVMSGDQVYVDDVAGPTLHAIHQVIAILGLFDEHWSQDDSLLRESEALFQHPDCYYQRNKLLPSFKKNTLFGQKIKPIFTSTSVNNHLISLSEVVAMYLLTWSPELWQMINIETPPANLSQQFQAKYSQELKEITLFHQGLFEVRRAMAHLPVYMIFDDHDITDDWNLTRGWEEAAYGNSFSKTIIGNALIGYCLCQGWGNAPNKFTQLLSQYSQTFKQGYPDKDELIDTLFDFDQWNYNLNTVPKILVLDTRTQRWRSESNANKPSGLMDWETLTDFQQDIVNEPQVIVVSAAPIYGVKLIETIQKIFTLCGKPLAVDAENWMAHSGTASVILNIFRNPRTPPNFIILSGDVHYSFVYEVTHRFRKSHAKIIQVTCSGIKNTFPEPLLTWLEQLNRVLYSTYSPLNWFTKRRRMKIRVRKPDSQLDTHLLNNSGIGLLRLNKKDDEVITEFITAQGKTIAFLQYESDEN